MPRNARYHLSAHLWPHGAREGAEHEHDSVQTFVTLHLRKWALWKMFLRAQDAPCNVGHSPNWFTSPTSKCGNMFTRKFRYKNTKLISTKIYDGYSPIRKYKLPFFSGQKMHLGHSPGLGPPSTTPTPHIAARFTFANIGTSWPWQLRAHLTYSLVCC